MTDDQGKPFWVLFLLKSERAIGKRRFDMILRDWDIEWAKKKTFIDSYSIRDITNPLIIEPRAS
jgi:hypothetical protein